MSFSSVSRSFALKLQQVWMAIQVVINSLS